MHWPSESSVGCKRLSEHKIFWAEVLSMMEGGRRAFLETRGDAGSASMGSALEDGRVARGNVCSGTVGSVIEGRGRGLVIAGGGMEVVRGDVGSTSIGSIPEDERLSVLA